MLDLRTNMAAINEASVLKKLNNLTNTQESIQGVSLWALHHRAHHERLVKLWLNVVKESKPSHRLALFYLCNDIIQNCKRKKVISYKDAFKEALKLSYEYVRDPAIKPQVIRLFKIWAERKIYDDNFCEDMIALIENRKSRSSMNTKQLEEFQPSEATQKLHAFFKMKLELDRKRALLPNLNVDSSNLESIRQLKDRDHGKVYTQQFEDACSKHETHAVVCEHTIRDQMTLVDILEKCEIFYDAQYGEAKVVANAYRNFGARVANLKKKLEEMKSNFPAPEKSPSDNSYYPSISHAGVNLTNVDMEVSDDESISKNKGVIDGNAPYSPTSLDSIVTFEESSPEDCSSQEDKANRFKENTTDKSPQLDQIITQICDPKVPFTSFIVDEKSMKYTSKGSNTPHSYDAGIHDPTSNYSPKPIPTLSSVRSDSNAFMYGDRTPVKDELEDERSGTPVLDEKRNDIDDENSRKDTLSISSVADKMLSNPIDFLTQLISQSSKANKKSSSSSDIMQNLPVLAQNIKSEQFEVMNNGPYDQTEKPYTSYVPLMPPPQPPSYFSSSDHADDLLPHSSHSQWPHGIRNSSVISPTDNSQIHWNDSSINNPPSSITEVDQNLNWTHGNNTDKSSWPRNGTWDNNSTSTNWPPSETPSSNTNTFVWNSTGSSNASTSNVSWISDANTNNYNHDRWNKPYENHEDNVPHWKADNHDTPSKNTLNDWSSNSQLQKTNDWNFQNCSVPQTNEPWDTEQLAQTISLPYPFSSVINKVRTDNLTKIRTVDVDERILPCSSMTNTEISNSNIEATEQVSRIGDALQEIDSSQDDFINKLKRKSFFNNTINNISRNLIPIDSTNLNDEKERNENSTENVNNSIDSPKKSKLDSKSDAEMPRVGFSPSKSSSPTKVIESDSSDDNSSVGPDVNSAEISSPTPEIQSPELITNENSDINSMKVIDERDEFENGENLNSHIRHYELVNDIRNVEFSSPRPIRTIINNDMDQSFEETPHYYVQQHTPRINKHDNIQFTRPPLQNNPMPHFEQNFAAHPIINSFNESNTFYQGGYPSDFDGRGRGYNSWRGRGRPPRPLRMPYNPYSPRPNFRPQF